MAVDCELVVYRPGRVLSWLSDIRVVQYWDKNHLFAEQLGLLMKSDPEAALAYRILRPKQAWLAALALASGMLRLAVYFIVLGVVLFTA